VSRSEEFKTLTPCRLSKIIASDEIHVDCESQVYNAVLVWVEYDPPARQQYFKMLLEAVSVFFVVVCFSIMSFVGLLFIRGCFEAIAAH